MNHSSLTQTQIAVAQSFFELPESNGFVVVGGAALLALGLSTRPTQDLDVFANPSVNDVTGALEAFERSVVKKSWQVRRITSDPTFCRFSVDIEDESVLVDLAIDAAAVDPPTITVLGPTMSELDVAARKVMALFDRAAARDFVDVYVLTQRFDRNELVRRAMLDSHERFGDEDYAINAGEVAALRSFFADWAAALRDKG